MSYCCSQCNFKAQFASALAMHRQLEHGASADEEILSASNQPSLETAKSNYRSVSKASTLGGIGRNNSFHDSIKLPASKGLGRQNSATRLFERLRTKICRSKMAMAVHQEENTLRDVAYKTQNESKPRLSMDSSSLHLGSTSAMPTLNQLSKETYRCHLCPFVADRITVLDRHLLNDHKISLDHLLKLVMTKTKEGVNDLMNDNDPNTTYYKPQQANADEGAYTIETHDSQLKTLKNAAVNTDLHWKDIPNFKDDCKSLTEELEKLMRQPLDSNTCKDDLFLKVQRLNDCMCKFVESSNVLKRVLKKDMSSKSPRDSRRNLSSNEEVYNYGIGDQDIVHRDWSSSRPLSDTLEKTTSRNSKPKSASCSLYY